MKWIPNSADKTRVYDETQKWKVHNCQVYINNNKLILMSVAEGGGHYLPIRDTTRINHNSINEYIRSAITTKLMT